MRRTTKRPNSPRHIGLARAISKLGFCSRSRAAQLVRSGEVRLNNVVRLDPETPVVLERDQIKIGEHAIARARKIYLMMNKPRGLVTTASDEKGRATIYDLVKKTPSGADDQWIAPIGRLDKASEGLLLLTNDSEWGARIAAPDTHLDKTYHVQVARVLDEEALQTIRVGVKTEGALLSVKRADLLRSGRKNCWLEIVLDEGKNRQIRRIFDAMQIEVLRLVRVAIGPLALGELPKGAVRELTPAEKRCIDAAISRNLNPSRSV